MPPPKAAQQLLRDGVTGHADRDRVLPAGDHGSTAGARLQHQRQRAGPEVLGELLRVRRHRERPALQRARMIDVHDHRMGRRAALQREDLGDGVGVLGVGAEPVDGFGRKRDELAVAQRHDRLIDLSLRQPCRHHP